MAICNLSGCIAVYNQDKNIFLSPHVDGPLKFVESIDNDMNIVKQYNKQGELIREINLPGVGSARGFRGKKDQSTLYYSFTNYKTPGTTFSFDVSTGESKVYRESAIDFNTNDYTSEQVFYTSKDGTKVPMIITYKTGIKL